MSSVDELPLDLTTVISRLTPFDHPLYSYKGVAGIAWQSQQRKSAVLVPLFLNQDGVPYVLLTQRSSTLRSHAGDVAFPGGMRDDGDSSEIETALREAEEEVGLLRSDVRIVLRLPPWVNREQVIIFPVVGIIPRDFIPKPNEAEVQSVFTVPLARFLSDDRHEAKTFKNASGNSGIYHIFTDTIDKRTYRTWGLTAGIITEVAIVVLQKKTAFIYHPRIEVTPENPFSAHLSYLTEEYNFPISRL